MIISHVNNVVKVRANDGQVFNVPTGKTTVMVPMRGTGGGKMPGIFDFGRLLIEDRVPNITTADEASAAIYIIRKSWPQCQEKQRAIEQLIRFIEDKREERRDMAVMQLVELYGIERAKKLSEAVRKHVFWFPAFYMREENVAKVIKYLLDECPGAAGSCQWTPSNVSGAEHVVSAFTSSKKLGGFRSLMRSCAIPENRIRPIFDIARYLELHK